MIRKFNEWDRKQPIPIAEFGKKDVVILSFDSGDWEILYVNGKKVSECHRFNNVLEFLKLSEKHGFKSTDVRKLTASDEDEEVAYDTGTGPDDFKDLKGDY